jgi:hypothetical protein
MIDENRLVEVCQRLQTALDDESPDVGFAALAIMIGSAMGNMLNNGAPMEAIAMIKMGVDQSIHRLINEAESTKPHFGERPEGGPYSTKN